MPELYNKNMQYYSKFKEEFDNITNIFGESEDLIDTIGKLDIDTMTYAQRSYSLIITRNRKLLVSILKLCGEGHGEDAGILLRTLFESYIVMEFMKKYNLFEKYFKSTIIKIFEKYEKMIKIKQLSPTGIEENQDKIDDLQNKYNYIKDEFKNEKGKIVSDWTSYDICSMCIDLDKDEVENFIRMTGNNINRNKVLGEKQLSYELLHRYHSSFIHCDPIGQSYFVRYEKDKIYFDCCPSFKDVENVLIISTLIFSRIVKLWANSFDKKASENIENYAQIHLTGPPIVIDE